LKQRRKAGKLRQRPAPAAATATSGDLPKAQEALQTGRFDEAERLLRRILRKQPRNPEALMAVAILAHHRGRPADAIGHLGRAIEIEPRNPAFHHVLGEIHAAGGDTAAAISCFDRALALDRNLPDSLFSRANALAGQGRRDEAIADLGRAVALSPRDAEAHLNLGNLLAESGAMKESRRHLETALSIRPGSLPARVSLAAHNLAAGNFNAAINLYDAVLADHPDLFEALLGRGRAALRNGAAENALPYLLRAHEQRQDVLPLLLDLGEACFQRAAHDAAGDYFRDALRLAPDTPRALIGLGGALRELGRIDEAEAVLLRAVAAAPESAEAHYQLGILFQRAGRFDDAANRLRQALDLDPRHAPAYGALAADRSRPLDDATRARMDELAGDDKLRPDNRAILYFALGQVEDDSGRHDAAFGHFRAANELRAAAVDFDLEAFGASVAAARAVFDSSLFEAKRGLGRDSDVPVFVVGMPRSGTTLVERIIAAHPRAAGAGELRAMREASQALAGALGGAAPYPDCVGALTAEAARKTADEYLSVLTAAAPPAQRIVDKMPNNFRHLGLIALLLPQAHIVHCRRDPLDTALSCYFQNFGIGVRFSYDLAKIGAYYRLYAEIMDHWRTVLPMPILDIDYENLVTDPEAQSRRLIDFIGLDWDDSCLAPHAAKGPVKTASLWQVRQPVYRSSIGRWRHYDKHLAPLRRALEGDT